MNYNNDKQKKPIRWNGAFFVYDESELSCTLPFLFGRGQR